VATQEVAPELDQVIETEVPKGTLLAEGVRVRVGPVGLSDGVGVDGVGVEGAGVFGVGARAMEEGLAAPTVCARTRDLAIPPFPVQVMVRGVEE
jgi:hypothetical protein